MWWWSIAGGTSMDVPAKRHTTQDTFRGRSGLTSTEISLEVQTLGQDATRSPAPNTSLLRCRTSESATKPWWSPTTTQWVRSRLVCGGC